jgi:hypothetical protein
MDSGYRSLAKAVSWRITGSIDTFLVAWIITGQATLAGGIATFEFLSKTILYWLHERVWLRISWGTDSGKN